MRQSRKQENGITFGVVVVIVAAVGFVLILTMMKIYLSNQIYHESKVVNKMKREVNALKAEHIILKQKVEALKYKNEVADTIFGLDSE